MSKKNIMKNETMEKIVSLCKRKGYIFQSSEIYGGLGSCWDYGPLGVELKNNVKKAWWQSMVYKRYDIEGLDASILMHPRVWEASGHISNFTDPLVDCKSCKQRFREDQVLEAGKCPSCGGQLTEVRKFNLMFKTNMGPIEDAGNTVFLRPETAQGIYVNFLNVQTSMRKKIPFGIAQIGKAFRNEITPGNFTFRTREFEQMEMQYFVKPGEDKTYFEEWKSLRMQWYKDLGINPAKLSFHQHGEGELAHYASCAFDIQYEFPFGPQEIEGIHNRSDYDLKQHTEFSGKDLNYFDEATKERYIPYVVETSAGADRGVLTFLIDAYTEEEDRVVMKLSPKIAPIKAAIFPLVKRDNMPEIAKKIVDDLTGDFKIFYDESGSIGRRYRRQDEAGTPFCVTVDSETITDETVTLRERDSMKQERIKIADLKDTIKKAVSL